MNQLYVYVDGSYNLKTKYWGAAAIILNSKQEELETISFSEFDAYGSRQIAGECFSTVRALETIYQTYDLEDIEEIIVCYDYEGIEKWANFEWKVNSAIAKEYLEKIHKIMIDLILNKDVDVEFSKVKAHSNHTLNDKVDMLAKKACGVEV
jgi:ribonuclease H